jgi:hypothetical protein
MLEAQEIYKSVDAAGHVTYSDQPNMSNAAADADPEGGGSEVAGMNAATAPPPLPANDQPPCPEDGDLWTPGYWAWDGTAYYWVAGAWVPPPRVGVLWTPGYWAYTGVVFIFHRGYWGPVVGYYGGINYGFGYWGAGYAGGHWVGNVFAYNRAASNVNPQRFRNVYDEPVVNRSSSHVSYNGGPGGTSTVPSAQELAAQSRLTSQPQRIHLQPAPVVPAASVHALVAPSTQPPNVSTPGVNPALTHPSEVTTAGRTTASAAPPPRAARIVPVRPPSTPSNSVRPRSAPTMKAAAIK